MPEPVGQTKSDGEKIKRISLSPRVIAVNYKNLMINSPFMLGSIALGLMGLPCLAWIALAPVILIADAKLSVIQYGIWQMPVFGASIVGNWYLQKLTHRYSVEKILLIGSVIIGIGLVITSVLPFLFGHYFIWLMPGLIIYFLL
nr:hypothetical protein [Legionella tunisiensis]